MPRIFISYRRNDSASNAGRIFDRLEGHFGEGQVFMDVDTIKPGVNFVEELTTSRRVRLHARSLATLVKCTWDGAPKRRSYLLYLKQA